MNRYDRQISLPEIGAAGQARLGKAKVLIVGVGGLGSPIALYLAGAGVGTLAMMDDDRVGLTNLQRQILYTETDIGQNKALCAARRVRELNGDIQTEAYPCRLDKSNACELISQYDIVVDGCDNLATRYLISDTCHALGKPYVYGAIRGFEGQVSVFCHGQGAKTYRDLYPDEDGALGMTPQDNAVMGVTPAIVGIVEANEVLKLIAGYGEPLAGKLWTIDLRTMMSNMLAL